jgi:GDSL-like Lipase/Acylhydrolase family
VVCAVLGLHILLTLLLLGKQPLLMRAAAHLLPRATSAREGMGLAMYDSVARSGPPRTAYSRGSQARIEDPSAALDAFAVWDVRKVGTYTLIFNCDGRGAVAVDGHRVLGCLGRTRNDAAGATVQLHPGRHFLVVSLTSDGGSGWFALRATEAGGREAALLAGELLPLQARSAALFWRWAFRGLGWLRGAVFWVSLVLLLVVTLALQGVSTIRQAAVSIGLVVASTLLTVLVGEMAVRLVLAPPQRVSFRGHTGDRPIAATREVLTIPTERGFRHNPNSEVVVENTPARPGVTVVYRTNSIGYRNRELGPRGSPRILFLGDSVTFGLGVNEDETFVRMVEVLARRDGKPWETVNAGVSGLGTNGEIAVLTETGLSTQPDVVVLGFYLNDFLESPGIYLTVLPGLLDRSWLAHRAVDLVDGLLYLSPSERQGLDAPPMLKPPDEIHAWQQEFMGASTVLPRDGALDQAASDLHALVIRFFEDWGGAFSPHVWNKLDALLTEYVRLAREHHVRPAIVAFPVRYQVEPDAVFDYPQRRLQAIAARLDVPYLDLLPPLRAAYRARGPTGASIFLDHCHLSPQGNLVAASTIYGFLSGLASSR